MSPGGRLLLTGATGFVGRAVLERAEGIEFAAVTRNEPPDWGRDLAGVEWVAADLSRPGFERGLPTDLDAILHLARSRRQHEFPEGAVDVQQVNAGSTARLLDHARRSGVARFVLLSTASVYAHSDQPLREDAPLRSVSNYSATKRGAELLLESYAGVLAGLSLRLFTPYGPGQRDQMMAGLIERVRSGKPIEVAGERGLLMSPIHVDDAADGVLAAARAEIDERGVEPVNLGGPDQLGIREVGEILGDALGSEPRFERSSDQEPGGMIADRTRAAELLGLPEPVAFREGIRRTLEADPPA